ncbi:hypothetical protein E2I00_004632 [Balaenoptera physalus]|uniref:Outer dense fiber of sperm tails 3B n=1 Tax=Balaenoptera physalus TaxID=9770 RepID=A0A643BXE1_BALPH|nr:hypothetical protein E2I00_004632 [Balaenoptera physalus]
MAQEVWVGTWRPHRPRGPIMALYSSPGPNPSTPLGSMGGRGEKGRVWLQAAQSPCPTGSVKHTPNKLRAPAYSFHGAPMLLAENCSPGPRYSVNPKILRTGKDLGPAYSILGRYCTKTTLTPGPGDYFPEKSTKHTPGPAAYRQTNVQVTKFKAPHPGSAPPVTPSLCTSRAPNNRFPELRALGGSSTSWAAAGLALQGRACLLGQL